MDLSAQSNNKPRVSSPHEGHRRRVKAEFLLKGLQHSPDHEKLELLLFYAIPRGDTNVTAHALIDRFGSLSGVFDAPYEALLEVPGIGANAAGLVKTVSALVRAYMDDYSSQHSTIRSTEDAKEYMRYKFLCLPTECVMMACLGSNGKVIFCDTIAEGSPETVQIRPSDLIRKALVVKAVRVILAHNHPGGVSSPSSRDVYTTRILKDEFARVDIELYDHIITATDGVTSLREVGML